MAIWAIGDIQGCYDELQALLEAIHFDPAIDRLWLVGDLVNRGPKSLKSLRFIKGLGDSVTCVLGNHDLHLLALDANPKTPVKDDWLQRVLAADDSDELMDWLRQQPLVHFDASINTLMVHAGVAPSWSLVQTLRHAAEVEHTLRGDGYADFLKAMYGSKPSRWDENLQGIDRLRFITNCLTRIRYCTADGELEFDEKFTPGTQPDHLLPWFKVANRRMQETRIVFGHWSTLGYLNQPGILSTDTGCVWGGQLTAVRLDLDVPPVQVQSLQPKRH